MSLDTATGESNGQPISFVTEGEGAVVEPLAVDETQAWMERLGVGPELSLAAAWRARAIADDATSRWLGEWGAGGRAPVLWGVDRSRHPEGAFDWIDQTYRGLRNRASADDCEGAGVSPVVGGGEPAALLQSLHFVHFAGGLTRAMDLNAWTSMLGQVLSRVESDFAALPLGGDWLASLRHVELPLSLAVSFPEWGAATARGIAAVDLWRAFLERRLDGAAQPLHAATWPELRALYCSQIRAWALAGKLRGAAGLDLPREPLMEMTRQTLRAARADATQMLAPGDVSGGFRRVLKLAARLSGDDRLAGLVRAVLANERPSGGKRRWARDLCRAVDDRGPWILRARWRLGAPAAAVRRDGDDLAVEIGHRRPLLAGVIDSAASIDGRPAPPRGDWRVMCWHHDEDVQFLECERPLADGWLLDRVITLDRRSATVVLLDNVIGPGEADIDYRWKLPLSEGIEAVEDAEHTELCLTGDRPEGLLLPLSLPEWRSARGDGQCRGTGGQIELQQRRRGSVLTAAVCLGLAPKTCRQPRTWRPLHVAAHRRHQSLDRAAAFRVRIGRRQWLVYRQFGPREAFSVFGAHLRCEFFWGRIARDWTLHELIRIE